MRMSPEINELATALLEYQKVKKPAKFDSEAMATKTRSYKYASLGSVDDTANPMTDYGLSYSMFPISDGWYIGVDVILMHTSGQWLSERFMFPMDSDAYNPAQEAGKIITYARRYALSAILGITADEDVDAMAEQKKSSQPKETNADFKDQTVEEMIEKWWEPRVRKAEEWGIDVEPLPPEPTVEEVTKALDELADKMERAK
jgi:hypothetical protein